MRPCLALYRQSCRAGFLHKLLLFARFSWCTRAGNLCWTQSLTPATLLSSGDDILQVVFGPKVLFSIETNENTGVSTVFVLHDRLSVRMSSAQETLILNTSFR